MNVNENVIHLGDRAQWEFGSIQKWLHGKGIDVGCGSSRLSPDVLAIDQQPDKRYADADIVHDCKDLEIEPVEWKGQLYEFKDQEFDFIFSSHCLEDFEDVPKVFSAWWKKLALDGRMILLLPDMQGGRYPTVAESRNGKGNPSHRTDVGKEFVLKMLDDLDCDYVMDQMDTLEHNKTCSIDFVIRRTR